MKGDSFEQGSAYPDISVTSTDRLVEEKQSTEERTEVATEIVSTKDAENVKQVSGNDETTWSKATEIILEEPAKIESKATASPTTSPSTKMQDFPKERATKRAPTKVSPQTWIQAFVTMKDFASVLEKPTTDTKRVPPAGNWSGFRQDDQFRPFSTSPKDINESTNRDRPAVCFKLTAITTVWEEDSDTDSDLTPIPGYLDTPWNLNDETNEEKDISRRSRTSPATAPPKTSRIATSAGEEDGVLENTLARGDQWEAQCRKRTRDLPPRVESAAKSSTQSEDEDVSIGDQRRRKRQTRQE